MELYFTDHCGSARGQIQSDMISHQSGEECAMLIPGDGEGGKEGMSERAWLVLYRRVGAGDEKSMNGPHRIPNTTSHAVFIPSL